MSYMVEFCTFCHRPFKLNGRVPNTVPVNYALDFLKGRLIVFVV